MVEWKWLVRMHREEQTGSESPRMGQLRGIEAVVWNIRKRVAY